MTHLESTEVAQKDANERMANNIGSLQSQIEDLKRQVAAQGQYIAELKTAGMHELLIERSIDRPRAAKTVLSSAVDVLGGMEPSIASAIHMVPADEIISWTKFLSEQLASGGHLKPTHLPTANIIVDSMSEIELLENQIVFNSKNYYDREAAARLEISCLTERLRLEKSEVGGAVAGT